MIFFFGLRLDKHFLLLREYPKMSRKFFDWNDTILNPKRLPKYQPFTSKEIHFLNFNTINEALDRLIYLAKQVKYFVIEMKYDYQYGYDKEYPALIQILFDYNMTLQVILIDAKYLKMCRDEDKYDNDWQYDHWCYIGK